MTSPVSGSVNVLFVIYDDTGVVAATGAANPIDMPAMVAAYAAIRGVPQYWLPASQYYEPTTVLVSPKPVGSGSPNPGGTTPITNLGTYDPSTLQVTPK